MSDLRTTWSIDNLRLAWARIRSNPDRAYKGYFRELYAAYAAADEKLLSHLQDRLTRGVFQPSDACKLYFPKPSGILRPYSLLVIEDQIVYQAISNTVAEALAPHVRHRYNKEVFGHMYAGVVGPWFYKKWSDGYKAFNTASRAAFASGHTWTASFDLTAFYDSIDHHVLRQMLARIGIAHELSTYLTDCLTKWTATKTQIYHNHGIPQGPISSGLIAEAVLKHFDESHGSKNGVKYLRYVDDIRLFAKKEKDLRRALIALDHLSKDVGLFPQSSKIDIRLVTDIETELKTVSSPVEEALEDPRAPDQLVLRKRIAELTPGKKGYAVQSPTRFKYLVAHATPSAQVADRLWKIYEHSPHYYPQLAAHLAKFKIIPDRHARRLIKEIEAQDLYPAVQASLIKASEGRLPSSVIRLARSRIKPLWKPRHNPPDLSEALWRWLHEQNHLTVAQTRYGLFQTKPEWLRSALYLCSPWESIPEGLRNRAINDAIRSRSVDVAVVGAWLCGMHSIEIERPVRELNPQAKIILKELGMVRRANASVCGIRLSIQEMTGQDIEVNWKKLFGKNYKRAEAQLVACKGYFKTNATAWVNSMDGFVDWLLVALYAANPSLGTYQLGNVGGVMKSTQLKAQYPHVSALLNQIHGKRYQSHLSHAVVKATKRPTKAVPFKWLKVGARHLSKAANELAVTFVV